MFVKEKTITHKIPKLLILFILLSMVMIFPALAEVKVVGSLNIPNSTLTKEEVKRIFMGEKKLWDNNKKIKVVALVQSNTQKKFHKKFLKVSLAKFVHTWRLKIYKGQSKFPKIFDTEAELVDFIASNDNIIGYVDIDTNIQSVKEFTII